MNTLETIESLHAYAGRLQRDAMRTASGTTPRRSSVRSLVSRVRRTR